MFRQTIPIILASASPRRHDFLRSLQLDFSILPASIDETPLAGEAPDQYAKRMAGEKASVVAEEHPDACVIGADTLVSVDESILGKPADTKQALQMLQTLRGRTHTVISGVAIIHKESETLSIFTTHSQVTFAQFDDEILKGYISTGDPMDKAGGYGIQSIGGFLIDSLQGSYSNVAGLPLSQVLEKLLSLGFISS